MNLRIKSYSVWIVFLALVAEVLGVITLVLIQAANNETVKAAQQCRAVGAVWYENACVQFVVPPKAK